MKFGDPNDKSMMMGPLINEKQVKEAYGRIQETLSQGATLALEGTINGALMSPWIIRDATNEMVSAKCEMFAPVVTIIPVKDVEEAIAIANDTEYGLSNSVFTKDLYNGLEVARRLESGMAHVNDQSITHEPHVLFGGEKNSGVGKFNGEWVIDKFTTEQWVSVQSKDRY